MAIAACLPTWLSLGARWNRLLDMATSFVWWYAAAALTLLAVALLLRKWRLALFVLITFVVNAVQLAPYEPLRGKETAAAGPRLRVMSINVLTSNKRFESVLRFIDDESPDVVVLLEVDQRWVDAMAPLAERYPHQGRRIRTDNFGVAFYSRLPTESIAFRNLSPNGTPVAVARLTWNDRPLTILGAHPQPPMTPASAANRNADLAAFAGFVAGEPGDVVLMGDLNIAPFSPYFRDLLADSGLRDSAVGRGAYATWGTPQLGLVIPIDHVLHTPGLRVLDRRVGPDIGSDHRPVTVDFAAAGTTAVP